ncbi:MAG: Acyltransferase 3 [Pseudolabrys sp.]|jgi:peptidoglycan/LPS O-acetylase OafA/YrhL|nr:Acyltransferase 3 [Pseudolabrys sp.]
MRSTEGVYYSRLDHVRALAVYLVFCWHFLHMTPQFPVPYASAPVFPLALIDEGHTGVALFMTLSGYLFAKLAAGRQIDFGGFLWNRTMRLAPLLAACIAAWAFIGWCTGHPIPLSRIIDGFVLPTWPYGTWSVSIELHFYLVFPLLLLAVRRYGPLALLGVVAAALLLRFDWWRTYGEVQHLAYWTIFGRIDQFTLGMLFALAPPSRRALNILAAVIAVAFLVFWQVFDQIGGYYDNAGSSPNPLWIVIPTVEALTWSCLIAWYDGAAFITMPRRLDRALAKIGEWSYSIYLLHFFPAVWLRHVFFTQVGTRSDFYAAWLVATLAFVAFLPVAAMSYIYFERRFLAYRRPYLRARSDPADAVAVPR